MRCPRRYFYEYVLAWAGEDPNIHLEFGSAYHAGMEALLEFGYTPEGLAMANAKFLAHYRKFWAPEKDNDNVPKDPFSALTMFKKYCKEYADDFTKHSVLYTETAGTVRISADRVMYFKTDALLQGKNGHYRNKKFVREHKTASRRGNIWELDVQVGTYNHVGFSLFGPEDFYCVEVNEAIFQKSKPEVLRTPVVRNGNSMNNWLYEVNCLFDDIDRDHQRLASCKPDDPIMQAFPMHDQACKDFGKTCTWHDYCTMWANPLQRCDVLPFGIAVKRWDPSAIETSNKIEV
jgi:hypothetical protein